MNNTTAILSIIMIATVSFCFGKIWKNDRIDRTWQLKFNLLFAAICGECLKGKPNPSMCRTCKCKPLMDTYKRMEYDERYDGISSEEERVIYFRDKKEGKQ